MPSRRSSNATCAAARADLIASLASSLGADRAVKPLLSSLARRRKVCRLAHSSRTAARDPIARSTHCGSRCIRPPQ
jgi:hypothetical protein